MHQDAGKDRRPAAFRRNDVGRAVGDDFVAWTAVDQDGDLVAHGARRHENRRLFAKKLTGHGTQAVNAGVFIALLVANRRLGDGFAHARRGSRLGIAVQVDRDFVHRYHPFHRRAAVAHCVRRCRRKDIPVNGAIFPSQAGQKLPP